MPLPDRTGAAAGCEHGGGGDDDYGAGLVAAAGVLKLLLLLLLLIRCPAPLGLLVHAPVPAGECTTCCRC